MIRNIILGLLAVAFWVYISIQIYNIFKPTKEETSVTNKQITYDTLKGKWIRERDSVIVTYISHPTNKFQILNNIVNNDNGNPSFNIGQYKLININLIDTTNQIYTAENLYSGYINNYIECKIRLTNDTTMLITYEDAQYDIYHKIIDKKYDDAYYLKKLKGVWFNAEDSVYIKYITKPTNIFQTQNTVSIRYGFLKGESEYTDISILDTVNNIFSAMHLNTGAYKPCTIHLLDDNTLFMNYKHSAEGVTYKKIK